MHLKDLSGYHLLLKTNGGIGQKPARPFLIVGYALNAPVEAFSGAIAKDNEREVDVNDCGI